MLSSKGGKHSREGSSFRTLTIATLLPQRFGVVLM
ncbi:hypothetical protein DSM26151_26370 [Agromyces marinus]|nr:hypothetical protein DSM26151_26370 [Agromyces marinus]